jgi:hypothetical protein
MQSVDGNPRSVIPRTRTARRQFVFGGVAFEVLADKTLRWELPAGYERHVVDQGSTPVIADVICSVSVERGLPTLANPIGPLPCFRDDHERTLIFSSEVRAELSRVAPSRYAAAARVTAGAQGLSAMLLGIASAIVKAEGGLSLRAVAVVLGGRSVVVFLGPAGAGKTAAANLCAGAQVFARERVNLIQQAGQLVALSLPGSAAITLPDANPLCLPVAALLRVRQGGPEPLLVRLDPADQIAAVSESLERSDVSAGAEETRTSRVEVLCQHVAVHELRVVPGKPLSALLQASLITPNAEAGTGYDRIGSA